MIRIHVGAVKGPATPGTDIVAVPQDYIDVRRAIRHALRTSADLEIFVVTRVCDDWFWDLETSPDVEFVQDDPIILLCRKLRVSSLPPEVADPIVISTLDLMTLPDPADAISDANAWVLSHKLNAVWSVTQPSYKHLTQLLSWWAIETVPTILQSLVRRRLQEWIDHASGDLRDAYQALQTNPEKVVLFLCCWQALSAYHEQTRRQWLEEEGWYVPSLVHTVNKLGTLPLPSVADKAVSRKALAYWRRGFREVEQEAWV